MDDTSEEYLKQVRRNAYRAAERDGYDQAILRDSDGGYSFNRKYPGVDSFPGDEIIEVVNATK